MWVCIYRLTKTFAFDVEVFRLCVWRIVQDSGASTTHGIQELFGAHLGPLNWQSLPL